MAGTARNGLGRPLVKSPEEREMNVTCPNCATVYRVDPAKVPEAGVRARCNVCSAVFAVKREGQAETTRVGVQEPVSPIAAKPPGPPTAPTRVEAPRPEPKVEQPRVELPTPEPQRPLPPSAPRPAAPSRPGGAGPGPSPVGPPRPATQPASPGAAPRPLPP